MWSLIWTVILVFPLYANVSLGSIMERETSMKGHHQSHNLTHRRTHRRGKNRRASGAAIVGGAVMAGASALTSQLEADDDFHWKADRGGCKWFGTAPFCFSHKCPPDHHLARVATSAPVTDAYPDAFGSSCYRLFFLFWTKQEKHYCCKGDSNACFINTVTGRWVNGKDGTHVTCIHYNTENRPCGRMICSYFRGNSLYEAEAYFREAGRCTNFQIFGYQAVLRCGQISFFDKKANRSHDWFKYY